MKKCTIIAALLFSTACFSQSLKNSSKKSYSVFNPVPEFLLREFSTDRPDITESAYSVDAGHFQLETDLFKQERSNYKGVKSINTLYNVANLKIGLSRTVDLQVVVSSYQTSKIKSNNTIVKESGFGGLALRLKKNLWGNDGGHSALSALPYINLPVLEDEKISGGVVFPFAMELPGGWNFGAQFQTDILQNDEGKNYHLDFLGSATVSHELVDKLDFFVETVLTRDNEKNLYEYFLDGGLVYSVDDDVHIDSGIYYGLKRISSKTYFLGLSFRL